MMSLNADKGGEKTNFENRVNGRTVFYPSLRSCRGKIYPQISQFTHINVELTGLPMSALGNLMCDSFPQRQKTGVYC